MRNYRVISMVVALLLIAGTLISLGVFYNSYLSNVAGVDAMEKSDYSAFQQNLAEKHKQMDAQAQATYQAQMQEYQQKLMAYQDKKAQQEEQQKKQQQEYADAMKKGDYSTALAIESSSTLPDFELAPLPPFSRVGSYPLEYFNSSSYESEKNQLHDSFFNATLIYHSAILGFLILAEIGLLIALQNKKKIAIEIAQNQQE